VVGEGLELVPLPKPLLPKLPLVDWPPEFELEPDPKLKSPEEVDDLESAADPRFAASVEAIPPPNRLTLAFNCSIRGS
jgi:hypothetical protein